MDSKVKEDVTIAVVKGLDWPALRPYAVSLTRTGFQGMKIFFVEDTCREVRDNLMRLGFTVIDRITPPYTQAELACNTTWAYGRHRFPPAIDFLKRFPGRFRYVIWTDVRDLIFQTDTSVWLENNLAPHKIVVAGLGHLIKSCPIYNDPWVQASDPQNYSWIRETEALCPAAMAGEADAMLSLMESIYYGCLATKNPVATDQGMLDVLVRTSYKDIVRVPASCEGFSAQWFPAKNFDPSLLPNYGMPVFSKSDGVVYVPETDVPFSTVHLYDRDAEWLSIMRKKYDS
jgi:hypothetical protein